MIENFEHKKRKKRKDKKSSKNHKKKTSQKRKEKYRSENQVKPPKKTKQTSDRQNSKNKSKNSNNKKSEKLKNAKIYGVIGDILFYILVFLIIGGSAFVYFGDKDATILNHKIMTVLTNSMKQTEGSGYDNGFSKGSMIIIKNQDPYTLKEGDIITFNPVRDNKNVFLTHRIIKIDEEKKEKREAFITTKGDANSGTDVPIGASQVTGTVIKSIPNAGYVLSFLKKHIVIVAIFISTLFGIIATLKYAKTME